MNTLMKTMHGHTMVSSVQPFGRFTDWPTDVVYVGMPGNASRAFGIPDTVAIHGKPWACLKHPLGWETGFVQHLVQRMARWPMYEAQVRALHGLTLLCWCAAKDAPRCHAVILAEFAELLYHANNESGPYNTSGSYQDWEE